MLYEILLKVVLLACVTTFLWTTETPEYEGNGEWVGEPFMKSGTATKEQKSCLPQGLTEHTFPQSVGLHLCAMCGEASWSFKPKAGSLDPLSSSPWLVSCYSFHDQISLLPWTSSNKVMRPLHHSVCFKVLPPLMLSHFGSFLSHSSLFNILLSLSSTFASLRISVLDSRPFSFCLVLKTHTEILF